jgi:hypothetical protein
LFKGASAPNLDDKINTLPARQDFCWAGPDWFVPIVDQVIGPKGFGSCQLRIGRGCENDSGAHQLRKLQCKEGNASGALHKYRVTRPDTSEPDYSAPSRHASAWQGSGFRVAQVVRDRQQAALIEDAVLAQDPVQIGAKAGSELLGRRLSFEPALEEDRNDPIPWSKILDPAGNGFDYPCPSEPGIIGRRSFGL